MEVRAATQQEVQQAHAAGTPLPLVRLALDMCSCASKEEMHGNFYATLERGFEPIVSNLGIHKGNCSIFGSGPSISNSYQERIGDVFSINSSIWFLLEHKVIPKFHMIWDAAEVCEQFAVPHPEVTYLVASRCHPKVFEKLKDCKVLVWHAGGDHDIIEVMQKPEIQQRIGIQPLINGGSAGITRGMFVAVSLGYTDLHLFGGDSSYSDDGKTHIMGSVVKEKDMMVSLGDGSNGAPAAWFRTTPEWCAQVNEFRTIYTMMTCNNMKIEVHGEGLMKEMYLRLKNTKEKLGSEKFYQQMIGQEVEQRERDMKASKVLEASAINSTT